MASRAGRGVAIKLDRHGAHARPAMTNFERSQAVISTKHWKNRGV
jgi:hypothetical protein